MRLLHNPAAQNYKKLEYLTGRNFAILKMYEINKRFKQQIKHAILYAQEALGYEIEPICICSSVLPQRLLNEFKDQKKNYVLNPRYLHPSSHVHLARKYWEDSNQGDKQSTDHWILVQGPIRFFGYHQGDQYRNAYGYNRRSNTPPTSPKKTYFMIWCTPATAVDRVLQLVDQPD